MAGAEDPEGGRMSARISLFCWGIHCSWGENCGLAEGGCAVETPDGV